MWNIQISFQYFTSFRQGYFVNKQKKALLSQVQSASAMLIVSRLSFMGDVGVFKVKSANAKTHLASHGWKLHKILSTFNSCTNFKVVLDWSGADTALPIHLSLLNCNDSRATQWTLLAFFGKYKFFGIGERLLVVRSCIYKRWYII